MGPLLELKKQLADVEAECVLLWNSTLNLRKDDQSINQRMTTYSSKVEFKGEETINQFGKEVTTMNQESEPATKCLKDTASFYALCQFLYFRIVSKLGIYFRVYGIKEHQAKLYKDQSNSCFGLVVGLHMACREVSLRFFLNNTVM